MTPRCFAHPKCQPFWLGGASGAGRVRGCWTVPRRGTSPGAAGWGTPQRPGTGAGGARPWAERGRSNILHEAKHTARGKSADHCYNQIVLLLQTLTRELENNKIAASPRAQNGRVSAAGPPGAAGGGSELLISKTLADSLGLAKGSFRISSRGFTESASCPQLSPSSLSPGLEIGGEGWRSSAT